MLKSLPTFMPHMDPFFVEVDVLRQSGDDIIIPVKMAINELCLERRGSDLKVLNQVNIFAIFNYKKKNTTSNFLLDSKSCISCYIRP